MVSITFFKLAPTENNRADNKLCEAQMMTDIFDRTQKSSKREENTKNHHFLNFTQY